MKNKSILVLVLSLFVLLFLLVQSKTKIEYIPIGNTSPNLIEINSFKENVKPKNIILIIGDGTGLNQIALSRIAIGGPDFRLAIDQLPYSGISLTHSDDSLITDSAASATAWAAGIKTTNKFLSISPEKDTVPTIPELLSKKGFISGLVATSSITHATPAAFYAHVDSRYKGEEIARQLLSSPVSIALGGGLEFFDTDELQENSFLLTEKDALSLEKIQNYKKVIGLFDEDGIERSQNKPTQKSMTNIALEFLSLKSKECSGFFLMSEGSQIDWAAHDNNSAKMIEEFRDFDQTIQNAMNFVSNNGETLLVITADHETGGLQILGQDNGKVKVQWGTGRHTGIPVGVYAYGPGADAFTGVMDNTDIFTKILDAVDYSNLPNSNCLN